MVARPADGAGSSGRTATLCDDRGVRVPSIRWPRNAILSLALTVGVALGLVFAVQTLAVKPYKIPSGSMEPTLRIGQRVVVERVTHRLGESPSVGDVVVFRPPVGAPDQVCADPHQGAGTPTPCAVPGTRRADETFIKRVVGVAGDRIELRRGRVIRNGRRTGEPFIRRCARDPACSFPRSIVVPRDTVYVLGDNRGDSDDSRFWGPVPVDWVIGRAVGSYWPPSRIGGL